MGYNRELFAKVRAEYAEKRQKALNIAADHRRILHDRCPELVRIDAELAKTGMRIMDEIGKGRTGLEERLAVIRRDNRELQEQREECMNFYGYPSGYDTPQFECAECEDTGYVQTRMCVCMKRELSRQGMIRAGLSELFKTQNFNTFELKYYESDQRILGRMRMNKEAALDYAEHFSSDTRSNLLLCGGTGLGKTHLSTAIAGSVIERGFDVVYESAPNLLAAMKAESFGNTYNGEKPDTGRYFTCDLLIIDDLGAEQTNSFTLGCFYNLINTRLVSKKPMVISTNLTSAELRTRYNDRIASRLLGEFDLLLFDGKDVRMQKLGMK